MIIKEKSKSSKFDKSNKFKYLSCKWRFRVINPVLIIDRGLKFRAYQNIPSLKDYIVIDQYSYSVEYFSKSNSDMWFSEEFEKPDDKFVIRSVDVELSLNMIYHRVKISKGGFIMNATDQDLLG